MHLNGGSTWKHLRDWKRVFWSSHRMAEKQEIESDIAAGGCVGVPRKKARKMFIIESRVRPDKASIGSFKFRTEWKDSRAYRTEKDRDNALRQLNKNCDFLEYRIKP